MLSILHSVKPDFFFRFYFFIFFFTPYTRQSYSFQDYIPDEKKVNEIGFQNRYLSKVFDDILFIILNAVIMCTLIKRR